MQTIALIPIAIYSLVILFLLYMELRRKNKSGVNQTARDTALGTTNFTVIAVGMTLIGSNLGPADTMGLSEEGAKYGFYFLLFPALAGIQQIISGIFFANKIAAHSGDCITMGDIMGKSYSTPTKVLVGIFTLIQALAFTGILALAGGQILSSFFGIPIITGILFTSIFVGLYTYFGGMNSVIKTDIIQFFIILFFAVLALISAITILSNNWNAVDSTVFWRPERGNFTIRTTLNLMIAYFLGEAFLPMYSIRALIIVDKRKASKSFCLFGGFIIIYYAVMMIVGISSNYVDPSTAISSIAIVNTVSSLFQIVWLKYFIGGLALTALLGLTHSTLDSVLNAGATSFVKDVLGSFVIFSDNQLKNNINISILIIAIFGTFFSLLSNNLIEILLLGYAVWVPTIVFPFAYSILIPTKIVSKNSAVWGILGGILGWALSQYIFRDFFIPPILFGFLANVIFFLNSELISSRK